MITVTATTPGVLNNIALNKPSNADSEDIYELTNIALGKSATSDTYQTANPIASGNDGDISTRWCAIDGNTGHWWEVDLGVAKKIIGSEIMWEQNHAYQYKIETSNDNIIWKLVTDKTTNTASAQIMDDNFTVTARYVRITITGGVGSSWASFFEFRLFDGTLSPAPQKNIASNANDGNINSYWSAADGNTGHSWGVDLGSAYNLNRTQIVWQNSGNAYQYKIETSPDSINWNLAVDKTGNTSTLQIQTDSFKVVTARYVKVTVTGGTSNGYKASISEFRIYDGSTMSINQGSVNINCVKPVCLNCQIDSMTLNPWININGNGWQQTDKAIVTATTDISFSTLQSDSTNWQWSGPNGFTASTPSIRLVNVQKTDTGTYVVTHYNKSVSFKLTLTDNTGTENINDPGNVTIYPNPSTDGIINVVNGKDMTISVYDIEGKIVFNTFIGTDKQVLNLTSLQKGIYLAKLTSEKTIDYRKIILSD
jgi:hypothetical protein